MVPPLTEPVAGAAVGLLYPGCGAEDAHRIDALLDLGSSAAWLPGLGNWSASDRTP